ncbi:hypothetical protein [Cellulophaga fucicola]|uniref:hypothetical protein n=1 Tax=Cellulophaga fucicola TaxID=76595 RepID=UPI001114951E|nr:hypothetical protein [Cellulophaga fucicola]
MTKKKIVKITKLTLKINGFPTDLKDFVEKQWTIEYGYVELLKQTDSYIKVKLTDKAYLLADTFDYEHRIIRRNYLIRLIAGIASFFRWTKEFITKKVPKFFKRLFSLKSGKFIMQTIGVLSAILGFIWLCIEMYEWAVGKGFIN